MPHAEREHRSSARIPARRTLDQFYTVEAVAAVLWLLLSDFVDVEHFLLVEPSAGAGSFFRLMPRGRLGFDLVPRFPGVFEADFLSIEIQSDWNIVFVGNPPFGTGARLAIRFFNHAARMASLIAMILPRSFQKWHIENQLHSNFHLVHEQLVPTMAFLHDGKPHDVPTVFQIWERRDQPRRMKPAERTHPDFVFTTAKEADFTLRRVGSTAGAVGGDLTVSEDNHYFIKARRDDVKTIMENIDFDEFATRVTGQKSISMPEVVALYSAARAAAGLAERDDCNGVGTEPPIRRRSRKQGRGNTARPGPAARPRRPTPRSRK